MFLQQVPTTPVPRPGSGNHVSRARSATNDSAVSGKEDGTGNACFSGESNDSHADHQVQISCCFVFRMLSFASVLSLHHQGMQKLPCPGSCRMSA